MARTPRDKNDKTAERKISYAGLETLLKNNGLNKSDLAPLAGVTSNVVAAISNGRQISMYAAVKLCEFFHVDIGEIMSVVFNSEEDKDFAFSTIKRYVGTISKNDILVVREDDTAVISDAAHEVPVFVFRVPLLDENNNSEGLAKRLNQISSIISSLDD